MISFIRDSYIRSYERLKDDIHAAIENCLSRGELILREDVETLEQSLAELSGAKYAVGVNSCTDALIFALKSLGIKEGDEVITSGHTFWATLEAIIHCGARPILADVDFYTGTINSDLERLITTKTKAIIPVHISGAVCDMNRIKELADEYDLKIIEDSAQAIGSKLVGDAACFSFYPAKILGAFGDGGALVTNNDSINLTARLLRNHGGKDSPILAGYTSRLDNIQAAILNIKLKYLKDNLLRRRLIAEKYNKEFNCYFDRQYDTRNPRIVLSPLREIYQDYIIRVEKRDDLYSFLKEQGVETMKDEYPFSKEFLKPPGCRSWESTALRLPINSEIFDDEVDYVINAIKQFFER